MDAEFERTLACHRATVSVFRSAHGGRVYVATVPEWERHHKLQDNRQTLAAGSNDAQQPESRA